MNIALLLLVAIGCYSPRAEPETCNLRDDDLDGSSDEGADADGDGYRVCGPDPWLVDCNDLQADVHPEAPEVCDGRDNDCDGNVPPEERDTDMDGVMPCAGDCDDLDAAAHTYDRDRDGVDSCSGDCDDFDDRVGPHVTELCDGRDTDCDGNLPLVELDEDADGQMPCEGDCDDTNGWITGLDLDGDNNSACDPVPDCDDLNANVYPGAPELCDGIDNNCDGQLGLFEIDLDLDGVLACAGDCDDTDATAYPGAPELCNGEDDDCDGLVTVWEWDADLDGQRVCEGDCADGNPDVRTGDLDLDGYDACSLLDPDCDDLDPFVYPGAAEICDGKDNDCNGVPGVDDVDQDLDGWAVCAGDCDDLNDARHPAATEVCDGIDNNCDGIYVSGEMPGDIDGDGEWGCVRADLGMTTFDCDDTDPSIHTGAPEPCNGVDNDCDGVVDSYSMYIDFDEDGWGGNPYSATIQDCAVARIGAVYCEDVAIYPNPAVRICWSAYPGDCVDFEGSIHPMAVEVCGDHVDNDCDGQYDETCP